MEYTNLPAEERQATQDLLAAHGYAFVTRRHDLFAADENTLHRLVKPEEVQPYCQYLEDESITQANKLPYVVALLGETASQLAGIILDDSSRPVRDVLGDVFSDDPSNPYKKRKAPQVTIAMNAIARMRPHFNDKEKLAAFLNAELPIPILDRHQQDIDSAVHA